VKQPTVQDQGFFMQLTAELRRREVLRTTAANLGLAQPVEASPAGWAAKITLS
jgi:hypothetical protein